MKRDSNNHDSIKNIQSSVSFPAEGSAQPATIHRESNLRFHWDRKLHSFNIRLDLTGSYMSVLHSLHTRGNCCGIMFMKILFLLSRETLKKEEMSLSEALLTSLMIFELDDKSLVTEMCKVQAGHMGILLLSSKNTFHLIIPPFLILLSLQQLLNVWKRSP